VPSPMPPSILIILSHRGFTDFGLKSAAFIEKLSEQSASPAISSVNEIYLVF
jgi:hypothetical protein